MKPNTHQCSLNVTKYTAFITKVTASSIHFVCIMLANMSEIYLSKKVGDFYQCWSPVKPW